MSWERHARVFRAINLTVLIARFGELLQTSLQRQHRGAGVKMSNSNGSGGSQGKQKKSAARLILGIVLTGLMIAIIAYCAYEHRLARAAGNYEVEMFSARTFGLLCTLLVAVLACFSITVEDFLLDSFKFFGKLALKAYRLWINRKKPSKQKNSIKHAESLPPELDDPDATQSKPVHRGEPS